MKKLLNIKKCVKKPRGEEIFYSSMQQLCFTSSPFHLSLSLLIAFYAAECFVEMWYRYEIYEKYKKYHWQVRFSFFMLKRCIAYIFASILILWMVYIVVAYGGCAGTPACHKYNNKNSMMDEMKVIWDANVTRFRRAFDTLKDYRERTIFIFLSWQDHPVTIWGLAKKRREMS